MPYEFSWHDDAHTIIRIDMQGKVTWQAYRAIHEEIFQLLELSPDRIDLIYCDKAGIPSGNGIVHLNHVINRLNSYPNLGKIYTVALRNEQLVKAMVDTTVKIYRLDSNHYGGFVSSISEAETLIYQDRASN